MSARNGRRRPLLVRAGSGRSGRGGSRGLARRLVGLEVPVLELRFAVEGWVSLAALASCHSLVVFFYPGVQSRTGAGEEVDEDTVRAWAWRERDVELGELGFMVVGVSTQSPVVQTRFAWRELLGYMLLSDGELELAGVLGLPTRTVAGQRVYQPLTLVVTDGRVARVFYPVDPACEAAKVTGWIRRVHA